MEEASSQPIGFNKFNQKLSLTVVYMCFFKDSAGAPRGEGGAAVLDV